jgi:Zn-dependent protease
MDILGLVFVLVIILISMIPHEIMHGVVAHWLGDDTATVNGRVSLNPLRHIDPVLTIGLPMFLALMSLITSTPMPIFGAAKPVPINPSRIKGGEWGLALVALAGPLTNFLLAFLFFAALALFQPLGWAAQFLILGVQINLAFCIFNLIPIPPLDGSRILFAVAPDFLRRFMLSIERYGIIIVFMLIFVFGGLWGRVLIGGTNAIIDLFSWIFGV